jgi:hypothetical protein
MASNITWIATGGENDWSVGANWQGGLAPGLDDTANLTANGHYQVDVDAALRVRKLILGAENATLAESSSESIHANIFEMKGGIARLDAANIFDSTELYGGTAQLGDDHALGTKPLQESGTFIESMGADINLHNEIDMDGSGRFLANTGDTLRLSGALYVTQPVPAEADIDFGSSEIYRYTEITPTGTVLITSTSFSIDSPDGLFIGVHAGTVQSGQGTHAAGADEMFSDATQVEVDGSAKLDVRNFGTDVTLSHLSGSGTLVADSANTIHVDNASFTGTLSGHVDIEASGANSFGGHLGTANFTMAAGTDSLDFHTALDGTVTISAPEGSDATVTLSTTTTDKFTDFQDGNLTIDTTVSSAAVVSFTEGSGYILAAVHPGHGAKAMHLYFYGVSSSDDLLLGNDGHGHLQITYDGAGEIPAQITHDVAVASQVAEASFVPLPADHL